MQVDLLNYIRFSSIEDFNNYVVEKKQKGYNIRLVNVVENREPLIGIQSYTFYYTVLSELVELTNKGTTNPYPEVKTY